MPEPPPLPPPLPDEADDDGGGQGGAAASTSPGGRNARLLIGALLAVAVVAVLWAVIAETDAVEESFDRLNPYQRNDLRLLLPGNADTIVLSFPEHWDRSQKAFVAQLDGGVATRLGDAVRDLQTYRPLLKRDIDNQAIAWVLEVQVRGRDLVIVQTHQPHGLAEVARRELGESSRRGGLELRSVQARRGRAYWAAAGRRTFIYSDSRDLIENLAARIAAGKPEALDADFEQLIRDMAPMHHAMLVRGDHVRRTLGETYGDVRAAVIGTTVQGDERLYQSYSRLIYRDERDARNGEQRARRQNEQYQQVLHNQMHWAVDRERRALGAVLEAMAGTQLNRQGRTLVVHQPWRASQLNALTAEMLRHLLDAQMQVARQLGVRREY